MYKLSVSADTLDGLVTLLKGAILRLETSPCLAATRPPEQPRLPSQAPDTPPPANREDLLPLALRAAQSVALSPGGPARLQQILSEVGSSPDVLSIATDLLPEFTKRANAALVNS